MSLRAASPARLARYSTTPTNIRGLSQFTNESRIPVVRSLEELRKWRSKARDNKKSVGIVPTMGALHQGHLDLVKRSLTDNPFTVMTLFVNPMQLNYHAIKFAPTEDLSRYPRTLQRDLELLSTLLPSEPEGPRTTADSPSDQAVLPTPVSLSHSPHSASSQAENPTTNIPNTLEQISLRPSSADGGIAPSDSTPLVVFAPPTEVMYPLRGELQDLEKHKGVGVEMRGWGDVLEGQSRPQFFKGVATVCTKLFNAVEPDHAYFGQKDIQQALLLKMMLTDLLSAHPAPENFHILPTTRDPRTNLALSSRNAYLSPEELEVSPTLFKALSSAQSLFDSRKDSISGEGLVAAATQTILDLQDTLGIDDTPTRVDVRLDYIEVFDKYTFEPVRGPIPKGKELVIAGAMWVGKTRLIDNLLLGWKVD